MKKRKIIPIIMEEQNVDVALDKTNGPWRMFCAEKERKENKR
jgi:hypothetical protein